MIFNEDDKKHVSELLISGKSTKDTQDYLIEKYGCMRSKTSNIIKRIRKKLGIYNKLK